MTPQAYLQALDAAGIPRGLPVLELDRQVFLLLGIKARTARRYRRGETPIPDTVQKALLSLTVLKQDDAMNRMPIALAGDPNYVTVLCADGSIWRLTYNTIKGPAWQRLPDIPQEDAHGRSGENVRPGQTAAAS